MRSKNWKQNQSLIASLTLSLLLQDDEAHRLHVPMCLFSRLLLRLWCRGERGRQQLDDCLETQAGECCHAESPVSLSTAGLTVCPLPVSVPVGDHYHDHRRDEGRRETET